MRFLMLIQALAVAAICNLLLISAAAAAPVDGQLDFTVLRNGKEIASHRIHFRRDTDSLNVDIKTDIAVKILFVTAYRLEHHGTEIWRDGRLVALSSVTNDDGTPHDLEVRSDRDSPSVTGDGSASLAEANIIPASLWHEDILQGGNILNTLHGKKMAIRVRDNGQQAVPVHGKTVQARHYVITGDLERELWFDDDNVIVKVRLKGKDGSDIQYLLN